MSGSAPPPGRRPYSVSAWALLLLALALPFAIASGLEGELAESVRLRAALGVGALVVGGLLLAWRRRTALEAVRASLERVSKGELPQPLSARAAGQHGGIVAATNAMVAALQERLDGYERADSARRTILSGMVEGIVGVDGDSRVVLINSAARTMLGVVGDDVDGRPLWDVTRVPEVTSTVQQCLNDSISRQTEVVLGRRGGASILGVDVRPLADASRGNWGCVLVLHDLSRLRKLEKVRQDFVANVSHELKTPLTSMRAYLETILDDPEMSDSVRASFLEKALASTQRLAAIVSDLLSIARFESDEVSLDLQRMELVEIAESASRDARPAAEMRRVHIELAPLRQATPVVGDREALRTAVSNLLDNAIKYSPEGGTVEIALEARDGKAVLAVTDRGPGIPQQEQERIFERFYRVDKNRSRDLGGTGLGLSIVRNVVRRHGGEVSVESALGRGSTFRIALPLAP